MSVCSPWIEIDDDLAECGCPGDAPPDVIQSAIDTATGILYELSGRQWPGVCTEQVRPCRQGDGCGCTRTHLCECIGADVLVLARRRVISISEVLVDGAAFTDYAFYRPNWLVRTDDKYWPCCQDLAESTAETGTWAVTYTYGAAPTAAAMWAARVLTSELVKACVSDKTCRIPIGAVAVTRRGVTYDMTAQGDRKTGIAEVDLWLASVNPAGRRRRASVTSPDDVRFIPSIPSGS